MFHRLIPIIRSSNRTISTILPSKLHHRQVQTCPREIYTQPREIYTQPREIYTQPREIYTNYDQSHYNQRSFTKVKNYRPDLDKALQYSLHLQKWQLLLNKDIKDVPNDDEQSANNLFVYLGDASAVECAFFTNGKMAALIGASRG